METSFNTVVCQVGNDLSVLWGSLQNFYANEELTDREKRLIEFAASLLTPSVKMIGDAEIVASAKKQDVSGILDGERKVSIHMKGTHVEFKDDHSDSPS